MYQPRFEVRFVAVETTVRLPYPCYSQGLTRSRMSLETMADMLIFFCKLMNASFSTPCGDMCTQELALLSSNASSLIH